MNILNVNDNITKIINDDFIKNFNIEFISKSKNLTLLDVFALINNSRKRT